MPVYTFSTQTKKPMDDKLVQRIKAHCRKHHLNFSGILIEQLAKYEEQLNEIQRRREV